jgi:hypothetical protein
MKITLTPQESEEYFYNALCNGLDYIQGYGIVLKTQQSQYEAAKQSLKAKGVSPCYEDVLMEILRQNGKLKLKDIEGEGSMDAEITLADVHERVQSTPLAHLVAMINETDDADTADVILQHTFYQDIIFG